MNATERSKLARHCAEMMYGVDADERTFNLGSALLKDFPAILTDFNDWSDVFACQRVLLKLVSSSVESVSAPQRSQALYEKLHQHEEAIYDLITDWSMLDTGKKLTAFVDDDDPISLITQSPEWVEMCNNDRREGIIPDDVCVLIKRGAESE